MKKVTKDIRIKLDNRDGANLYLVKTSKEVDENTFEWYLDVDEKHKYCLKYMRIIGDWDAIDPSGGPFISVGDVFNGYTITKINSINSIWIKELMNT